jgi:hypothetical protein
VVIVPGGSEPLVMPNDEKVKERLAEEFCESVTVTEAL